MEKENWQSLIEFTTALEYSAEGKWAARVSAGAKQPGINPPPWKHSSVGHVGSTLSHS